MNGIKNILNKVSEYIKSNKRTSLIIGIAAILVIAIIITVICVAVSKSENDSPWGEGITQGIPAFEGELKSFDTDDGDSFQTVYFENVTTEQVNAYENTLSTVCGIQFDGQEYPHSAIYGDKIIVIHYNVTEMKLSVTVTQKSNS